MPRVCLNMIVRNEMANLPRCLAALAPHVDAYVIADTGSGDGTPDFIRDSFARWQVPGALIAFPFENFGQARNRALDAAKASPLSFDYLLFVDADMELVVEDPGFRDRLTAGSYMVQQRTSISYWNHRLVRRDCALRYRGVTHEFLETDGSTEHLRAIWFRDHASGANRGGKFDRDIALMTRAMETETDPLMRARYTFYIANSHRDADRPEAARRHYLERAGMGHWPEEVYVARLEAARAGLRLGHSPRAVLAELSKLAADMPHRCEAMHDGARLCREQKWWPEGYRLALAGAAVPRPADALFVEDYAYRIGIHDELSIAGYYVGEYERALVAGLRVLALPDLDPAFRARVKDNYDYSAARTGLPPYDVFPAAPPPRRG